MTEVLFTPALLAVALAVCAAFDSRRWRSFALLGFAIGVSDLIRPTLVLFPFFVAGAAFWLMPRSLALRNSGACFLAVVLTVASWTVHNAIRFQSFLPLATSNGQLWLGSPEYYHLTHEGV